MVKLSKLRGQVLYVAALDEQQRLLIVPSVKRRFLWTLPSGVSYMAKGEEQRVISDIALKTYLPHTNISSNDITFHENRSSFEFEDKHEGEERGIVGVYTASIQVNPLDTKRDTNYWITRNQVRNFDLTKIAQEIIYSLDPRLTGF